MVGHDLGKTGSASEFVNTKYAASAMGLDTDATIAIVCT